MASVSLGLAALDRKTVSSLLRREVHCHGQRGLSPVLQATRATLVLLDQETPRQLVFFRVSGLAGAPAEMLPRYADVYLRVAAEVLHPVRAVASSGEHVEGLRSWYQREPDLDLVRFARHAPSRRQVAEVLFGEVAEISHRCQVSGYRLQVLVEGNAARRLSPRPDA